MATIKYELIYMCIMKIIVDTCTMVPDRNEILKLITAGNKLTKAESYEAALNSYTSALELVDILEIQGTHVYGTALY